MNIVTSYQPRTGRMAGWIHETSDAEAASTVQDAVIAAPILEAVPPRQRRDWLHRVANDLEQHQDELVTIADRETALGRSRLTDELARTSRHLRFYGDVAAEGSFLDATIDGGTEHNPDLARCTRPLGPVAVFGASNFPFAYSVLGHDTASAIAAGCPVIAKVHPAHATLSIRLQEIAGKALLAAGAPPGTLGLVAGTQPGLDLVMAPAISCVAFTGSQAVGLMLVRMASERPLPIPVYAEMGTVNPVIVTPGAAGRLEAFCDGFVSAFTLGNGQYCTKPGILFVPSGLGAARLVGEALARLQPEPTMLTEGIASSVRSTLDALVEAGAIVERRVDPPREGWSAPAAVLSCPIDALQPASPLLSECFGPVAIVVEYDDVASLLAAVRRLQPSLVASVMTAGTADPDVAGLLDVLTASVGRVVVDDWPMRAAGTWAQHHGGPWPSTSNPLHSSVGSGALRRFLRPVAYQSTPDPWLPPPLQAANPWAIPRRVNGRLIPVAH